MILGTIQSYIDSGHTVTAHHMVGGEKPCSHYAPLDLVKLAERLGPDYSIPDNHKAFVAKLRCEKCGRKGGMSLIISPPSR